MDLLLRENYIEFIEHCESCKMGVTIKEFVDNVYSKFGSPNPNLLLVFMEFIELEYPLIENNEFFYAENILHFDEEVTDMLRPQLHYLYSYLCHLHDQVIINRKANKPSQNLQPGHRYVVDPNSTFKCHLPRQKQILIFNWLVENEHIDSINESAFLEIFSGTPLKQLNKKIKWIAKHNGRTNMLDLFYLLDFLCSDEYENVKKGTFVSKISGCFIFTKTKKTDVLRKLFYDWKRHQRVNKEIDGERPLLRFLNDLASSFKP